MDLYNQSLHRESADLLKGASPVPGSVQFQGAIQQFLQKNVSDPSGALLHVLEQSLVAHRFAMEHSDDPLFALQEYIKLVLSHENRLREFTRKCDVQWGKTMGERPYFDRDGQDSHPDDEYTWESVRYQLEEILDILA